MMMVLFGIREGGVDFDSFSWQGHDGRDDVMTVKIVMNGGDDGSGSDGRFRRMINDCFVWHSFFGGGMDRALFLVESDS